jgi:hypothetical protein
VFVAEHGVVEGEHEAASGLACLQVEHLALEFRGALLGVARVLARGLGVALRDRGGALRRLGGACGGIGLAGARGQAQAVAFGAGLGVGVGVGGLGNLLARRLVGDGHALSGEVGEVVDLGGAVVASPGGLGQGHGVGGLNELGGGKLGRLRVAVGGLQAAARLHQRRVVGGARCCMRRSWRSSSSWRSRAACGPARSAIAAVSGCGV